MAYKYYNSHNSGVKILEYAFPIHKVPSNLPKVKIKKLKGENGVENLINLCVEAVEITKPRGSIYFDIEGIWLNADGTFYATNKKNAVYTTFEGKRYYEDITEVKGKLEKVGNKQKITFTIKGSNFYTESATFSSENIITINHTYKTELISGRYKGLLTPVKIGTETPTPIKDKDIKFENLGDNKLRIKINPFRLSNVDMPGVFSVNINSIHLNENGKFYVENVANAVRLDMVFFHLVYPIKSIEGEFVVLKNGKYRVKFILNSDMTIFSYYMLPFILHYEGTQQ